MSKFFFFFIIFIYTSSCSFDSKTGIWSDEKIKISKIEKEQNIKSKRIKLFESGALFNKEIPATVQAVLTEPRNISSWEMSGMNLQNNLGNIFLKGDENIFLKKKIGKNKFSFFENQTSPLIYKNNIFFSDDTGSIFSINKDGKVNWKKNIYKKLYKKIYKNLAFSIYKDSIFVSDNIGFIYKIDIDNGELIWIKNHGIPLRSNIKIFKDRMFLINQDNRLLSFNVNDGSLLWDLRSVSSFIKSQHFLSLAISKNEELLILNSAGDLVKLNSINGSIFWSLNTLASVFSDDTDFFISSEIVLNNNNIFFSTPVSTFSFSLGNGIFNWVSDIGTSNTPIIDGKNVFLVSDNGFLVNLDKDTGKIIWSINILKVLKESKQITNITGFILGSGKIYAVTSNGYLIVCSARSGKVESVKEINDKIYVNPIISNGSLYILTDESRIIGFN